MENFDLKSLESLGDQEKASVFLEDYLKRTVDTLELLAQNCRSTD